MKVSTIRSSLVLFDLALCLTIGWTVWQGLQAKNKRRDEIQRFRGEIAANLEAHKTTSSTRLAKPEYGRSIERVNISDTTPQPVETPKPIEPPVVAKTPLESLVRVVAIQKAGTKGRSIAYLFREPQPGVQVQKDSELSNAISFYEEGEAIEWAPGATVKMIDATQVHFDYDEKVIVIRVKDLPANLGGAAPAGGASGGPQKPLPPPNNQPATWIVVGQPGSPIQITDVGQSSMAAKGDEVLEGVRWSTEEHPRDKRPAVRIDFIPEGSVLAHGGAKAGDVLDSINGVRMSSRGDVVSFVQANPNLPRYEVKFWRNGVLHSRIVQGRRGG